MVIRSNEGVVLHLSTTIINEKIKVNNANTLRKEFVHNKF